MYLVGNSCVIMYHDIYHDIYIYPILEKHCMASDMCVDPCPHQCCALSTLACVCPKMAIPKVAIAILHSNRKMMINHGIWGYPTSQYVQKNKNVWLRRHRHLHFPGTSWIMQMPCQSCQSSSTPKDSKRTHSKMQLKSFIGSSCERNKWKGRWCCCTSSLPWNAVSSTASSQSSSTFDAPPTPPVGLTNASSPCKAVCVLPHADIRRHFEVALAASSADLFQNARCSSDTKSSVSSFCSKPLSMENATKHGKELVLRCLEFGCSIL